MIDNYFTDMLTKVAEESLEISAYAFENGLQYEIIGNCMIVLSDMSYWKITYLKDWDSFALHHGNYIPNDVNPENYLYADYHYQKDVKPTDSIMSLLVYIRNHDDFRFRVIENVETLPRRTKKQKARYQALKQREKAYNKALILQMISAAALMQTSSIA
jgi:hypothetical protein